MPRSLKCGKPSLANTWPAASIFHTSRRLPWDDTAANKMGLMSLGLHPG